MGEKRYFWLRLQHDFFQSKRIKKLRKLAGGDTYTIIYLKMQLKAIMNDGVLTYTGIEPTFADELALDIDEEPDNVLVTVNYLLSCGLMEAGDGNDYLLPYAIENTGSETSAAKRMREFRDRQKEEQNVTLLHECSEMFKIRDGEKETEKEKESYIETETDRGLFATPSMTEIESFARERGSAVDPKRFFQYYEDNNWMDGKGKPVRDWKKKFISWEGYEKKKPSAKGATAEDLRRQEELDRIAIEQVKRLHKKMCGEE